mmetsp:Transcript_106733/g.211966  ORF Transcript_106733/g.211966 Transcript_106733/m.211966 type:complete len:271 (+) Transcript_106733:433-1245(+)
METQSRLMLANRHPVRTMALELPADFAKVGIFDHVDRRTEAVPDGVWLRLRYSSDTNAWKKVPRKFIGKDTLVDNHSFRCATVSDETEESPFTCAWLFMDNGGDVDATATGVGYPHCDGSDSEGQASATQAGHAHNEGDGKLLSVGVSTAIQVTEETLSKKRRLRFGSSSPPSALPQLPVEEGHVCQEDEMEGGPETLSEMKTVELIDESKVVANTRVALKGEPYLEELAEQINLEKAKIKIPLSSFDAGQDCVRPARIGIGCKNEMEKA